MGPTFNSNSYTTVDIIILEINELGKRKLFNYSSYIVLGKRKLLLLYLWELKTLSILFPFFMLSHMQFHTMMGNSLSYILHVCSYNYSLPRDIDPMEQGGSFMEKKTPSF